jgi:hypothetical protein
VLERAAAVAEYLEEVLEHLEHRQLELRRTQVEFGLLLSGEKLFGYVAGVVALGTVVARASSSSTSAVSLTLIVG